MKLNNFKNLSRVLLIAGSIFLLILAYFEVLPLISQYLMIKNWQNAGRTKNKILKPEFKGNPKQIGVLIIPKLKIKKVILFDAKPQNLDKGPALLKDSAYPGTLGHAIISGHRVSHNFPFRNINKLKKGDQIIFQNSQGIMVFKVTDIRQYIKSKKMYIEKPKFPKLSLTTCSPPYSARYRLIVNTEARNFTK